MELKSHIKNNVLSRLPKKRNKPLNKIYQNLEKFSQGSEELSQASLEWLIKSDNDDVFAAAFFYITSQQAPVTEQAKKQKKSIQAYYSDARFAKRVASAVRSLQTDSHAPSTLLAEVKEALKTNADFIHNGILRNLKKYGFIASNDKLSDEFIRCFDLMDDAAIKSVKEYVAWSRSGLVSFLRLFFVPGFLKYAFGIYELPNQAVVLQIETALACNETNNAKLQFDSKSQELEKLKTLLIEQQNFSKENQQKIEQLDQQFQLKEEEIQLAKKANEQLETKVNDLANSLKEKETQLNLNSKETEEKNQELQKLNSTLTEQQNLLDEKQEQIEKLLQELKVLQQSPVPKLQISSPPSRLPSSVISTISISTVFSASSLTLISHLLAKALFIFLYVSGSFFSK